MKNNIVVLNVTHSTWVTSKLEFSSDGEIGVLQ